LENHGPWYYEQQYLGYNYRMTDIQAALGISQLKKSDKFLQLRRDYAKLYTEAFKSVDEVVVPYQLDGTDSSWHLYILKLKTERLNCDRKKIFEELKERRIGVNVHYIPVYYHPFYRKLGYKKGLCPNAEDFMKE